MSELYQYTYSKTVAETARTLGGAQHPTYDYRMTGRGKVVLTDLTRGETQLQFGPEMAGTFLIVREETAEIVAEVSKPQGAWRAVALPSDTYLVVTSTWRGASSARPWISSPAAAWAAASADASIVGRVQPLFKCLCLCECGCHIPPCAPFRHLNPVAARRKLH